MQLSIALRKVAAHLLRLASDEFSNHGCNDYDLMGEAGLNDAEVKEMLNKLDLHGYGSLDPSPMVPDWLVMLVIAKEMENSISYDEEDERTRG